MVKQLMKNKFFLGGLALVIVAVAVAAFFQLQSTPERTIAKFAKAYAEKDVTAMAKCYPESDQALVANMFALSVDYTGAQTVVFVSFAEDEPAIEGDEVVSGVATVMTLDELETAGNRVSTGTLAMEKINGKWYLSTY